MEYSEAVSPRLGASDRESSPAWDDLGDELLVILDHRRLLGRSRVQVCVSGSH